MFGRPIMAAVRRTVGVDVRPSIGSESVRGSTW
jgi:hypothetical protein